MQKLGDFERAHELTDQELVSGLAGIAAAESRLAADKFLVAAEIDRRGLAMKLGHSSAARWYARSVRITDTAAQKHIDLGTFIGLNPAVCDALRNNGIHASHVTAIADGLTHVVAADPTIDPQTQTSIVATLLDTALDATAHQVTRRAQVLAHSAGADARARHDAAEREAEERVRAEREAAAQPDHRDPDAEETGAGSRDQRRDDTAGGRGVSPDHAEGHSPDARRDGGNERADAGSDEPFGPPPVPVSENSALNKLDLFGRTDGRYQWKGDFDKVVTEKLMSALSTLAKPQPGPGGQRDQRTAGQRRADALNQILDSHLRGGSSNGSVRPSLHVTVSLRDLLADPDARGRSGTKTRTEQRGCAKSSRESRSGDESTDWTQDRSADHVDRAAHSEDSPVHTPSQKTSRQKGTVRKGAAGAGTAPEGTADASPDRGRPPCGTSNQRGTSTQREANVKHDNTGRNSDTETSDGASGAASGGRGPGPAEVGAGDTTSTVDADLNKTNTPGVHAPCTDTTDARSTADSTSPLGGSRSAPVSGDPDWPYNLDWTGPISRQLAELLSCDADLTPVIVDHNGVPLAMGRTIRFATDEQRAALRIRDKCCVMCGRPASWCDAHHLIPWFPDGLTDLNNLALVCGQCHQLIHNRGWQLLMGDDGHPYAIPPASVDIHRQPLPSYHRRRKQAV